MGGLKWYIGSLLQVTTSSTHNGECFHIKITKLKQHHSHRTWSSAEVKSQTGPYFLPICSSSLFFSPAVYRMALSWVLLEENWGFSRSSCRSKSHQALKKHRNLSKKSTYFSSNLFPCPFNITLFHVCLTPPFPLQKVQKVSGQKKKERNNLF